MADKNSYSGKKKAAGLIFFEGKEKPRQYVIFQRALVKGQCSMEVFTTTSLQLEYSFLDKEQCEIYQRDGEWFYKNLSENVFTFVGLAVFTAILDRLRVRLRASVGIVLLPLSHVVQQQDLFSFPLL